VLHTKYLTAVVGKALLRSIPLYGGIIHYGQGIFVDRKTNDARLKVLSNIEERIKICKTTNMIPLNAFPEGTTSNGEQLLTFKKGSFTTFTPVKILCIKYETDML